MAKVEAIKGETTYGINGLSAQEAAAILALLGLQSGEDDVSLYDIYTSLEEALNVDSNYVKRVPYESFSYKRPVPVVTYPEGATIPIPGGEN